MKLVKMIVKSLKANKKVAKGQQKFNAKKKS